MGFQNDEEWHLFYCGRTLRQVRGLVTSRCGHKMIQNHKKENISEVFFCIERKLCTVVPLVKKFHAMSTGTFPWQHNGLHTLSIQREKSEFLSIKKCYLLLLFIPWVSVNMNITRHKQKTVCYTLDQQLRHFSFWESRRLVPSMLLW